MTPRQTRIELLRQHAEISQLIAEARRVSVRVQAGELLRRDLKAVVLHLTDAVQAHNHREEDLLRAESLSGASPRAEHPELMTKQHFEEHKALHSALLDVQLNPDDVHVAKAMLQALDSVIDHMASEEQSFAFRDASYEEDTKPG